MKEEEESTVVLTSPLSLDCESGNDYRTPNLLQRLLSLLKNVRPGSDLTRFTVCFSVFSYCILTSQSNCSKGFAAFILSSIVM